MLSWKGIGLGKRRPSFRPAWLSSGSPFDSGDDAPPIGVRRDFTPVVRIRLIPYDAGHTITAQTLSDTVACTQRIFTYASLEVARGGPQPSFADLRTVGSDIERLGKLFIEPFDEGSFVIPARLTEAPVEIETAEGKKQFDGRDVLWRFTEVMHGVRENANYQTSIGLLHAVEDLGRIVRREAESIQYNARIVRDTGIAEADAPVNVDLDYINRIAESVKHRESPIESPEVLCGRLTAVDVSEGRCKLLCQPRQEIPGSFTPFMQERMVQLLNKRVKLIGQVTYKLGAP